MRAKHDHKVPCAHCGKTLTLPLNRVKRSKRHYCDSECRRLDKVTMTCEVCQVVFTVPNCEAGTRGNGTERRVCSRGCSDALRRKPLLVLRCGNCGQDFECQRKHAKQYCSDKCLRTAPKNVTSIEIAVAGELERRNVAYLHQSKVGPYYPDFRVGDVVIEVDGDYWHSEKFPRNLARDEIKDCYYQDQGLRVIRIREHEVRSGDFSKLDCLNA